MRNKFFKRIFVSLVLIMVLGVLSAGCGSTYIPTIPVVPTTCTLTVYSQCGLCYGYVYVNSVNYGWIWQNGTVQVTGLTPGTTVQVQMRDAQNFYSHIEYLVLQPGANVITFYAW
jgi:hypothetical protein